MPSAIINMLPFSILLALVMGILQMLIAQHLTRTADEKEERLVRVHGPDAIARCLGIETTYANWTFECLRARWSTSNLSLRLVGFQPPLRRLGIWQRDAKLMVFAVVFMAMAMMLLSMESDPGRYVLGIFLACMMLWVLAFIHLVVQLLCIIPYLRAGMVRELLFGTSHEVQPLD